jgi:hypothetical protein
MSSAAASAHAASAAPAAASALPDMEAIKARVREIAAQATPQKISKPPTQSAIAKKKMEQFKNILTGKAHPKGKSSSFRYDSGVSDSRIGREFVHGRGQ